MDATVQDLRYALRRLRSHPGVSAAAIVTIGLAIGTAAIVFSAVDALLLRPPPFRDPSRLVAAEYRRDNGDPLSVSVRPNEVAFWAGQPELFSAFGGYYLENATVLDAGPAVGITLVRVTDGLMPLLGVDAVLGRVIGVGDAGTADQPPAVVLSHGLWQRVFGADPTILGRSIRLNGGAHTVVGVMGPTFRFPFGTEQAWVGIPAVPTSPSWRSSNYRPIGRLAAGVSPAVAAARMDVLIAAHPELRGPTGRRAHLYPLGSRQVGPRARQVLWMLVAVAVLLVLVASANVVNLLITDGEAQARQLAVCAALGASTARLLRGRILEGVVLTSAGALSGLWLGWVALPLFVQSAPKELWVVQINDIVLDGRVIAAASLVALACGVAAAMVSVWRTRFGDARLLRSGTRVQVSSRGRVVAAAQVAVVTVMLIAATLLARSYAGMTRVDPGFDVDRVLAFWVEAPAWKAPSDENAMALFARIEDQLRATPGVDRVALTPDGVPPSVNYDFDLALEIEGRGVVAANDRALVMTIGRIGPGYLETIGVPLRAGRGITADDRPGTPPVVVINETFARRYWPNGDALGGRFRTRDNAPDAPDWRPWHTVVGIAGDVYQHDALAARPPLGVYFAAAQDPAARPDRTFVVRAATARPETLVPALLDAVRRVDPDLPVEEIVTGADMYAEFLAAPRFYALLTSWMSGLGLLLAVVGVVGVSLVATARRTNEFGVRLALGAVPRQIAALVVGQAMAIVGGGVAAGVLGGWTVSRALAGLVSGVAVSDPLTLGLSAGLLAAVTFLGCWWPAHRALRVTPLEALREE